MEKIEICFKTGKATRKLGHLNDGSDTDFVKVTFRNSSDCEKAKNYMKKEMKHLELFLGYSNNSEELLYEYKKGNDKFDILGVDEVFDFSDLNGKDKPVSLQLFMLISTYLGGRW